MSFFFPVGLAGPVGTNTCWGMGLWLTCLMEDQGESDNK